MQRGALPSAGRAPAEKPPDLLEAILPEMTPADPGLSPLYLETYGPLAFSAGAVMPNPRARAMGTGSLAAYNAPAAATVPRWRELAARGPALAALDATPPRGAVAPRLPVLAETLRPMDARPVAPPQPTSPPQAPPEPAPAVLPPRPFPGLLPGERTGGGAFSSESAFGLGSRPLLKPGDHPRSLEPPAPVIPVSQPEALPVIDFDMDREEEDVPRSPSPTRAAEVAALLDQGSVREALDAQRASSAGASRHVRLAIDLVGSTLRSVLASRPLKIGLAAGGLLALAIFVPGVRSAAGSGALTAASPVLRRSYFLDEGASMADLKAWSDPGMLASQPEGLAPSREGVALFTPSMGREDYEFSFSARVRQGGLGWVVRAKDDKNYCAYRLFRRARGRDKSGLLARWMVVDGAAVNKDKLYTVTMPFELDEGRTYGVVVQVSGERITTLIESRGVDSYSDSRFSSGGVGLLAEKGDAGLYQSIALSGNDDATGRAIFWVWGFCGFLKDKVF